VNEWRPWYVDAQVAGWVALHQLVESTLWNKTNSSLSPHASVLSGLIVSRGLQLAIGWVDTCPDAHEDLLLYADIQGHIQITSHSQPWRYETWMSFFPIFPFLCTDLICTPMAGVVAWFANI
jgi:hypothetical protein